MSLTDRTTRPEVSRPHASPRAGDRWGWVRLAVVCALLVSSGLVRRWQDRRIRDDLTTRRAAVVPLERVPLEVGPWVGVATDLDPQIARGTGADRVVTRRYTNRNTGVTIDVILLFGPAGNMYIHSPTLCYPKAGFRTVEGPFGRDVEIEGGRRVPFQSVTYAKGEGPRAELQEVYWTWRYNDRWTPEVLKPKYIERVPSMIKVHTARPVLTGERHDTKVRESTRSLDPAESLLRLLLPEIERLTSSPTPRSA